MGGLARAAGTARLTSGSGEPHWLLDRAALVVAREAPTLWLFDLDDPAIRNRLETVAPTSVELALFAGRGDAGERLLRRRAARLLLAAAGMCRVDEVAIGSSSKGAPIVATPKGWHVSVAARWPDCLVGIAPEPLGVDLERIERDVPPDRELLARHERGRIDAIPALDGPRFFARAWAAKESHAKWTGEPRRVVPALVETEEARVTSPWGQTRCWRYERGEVVAAICTGG